MGLHVIDKTLHATLVAGVVDVVQPAAPCTVLFAINKALVGVIYVRTDGINPAIDADGTYIVQPNTQRTFTISSEIVPEIRLMSPLAVAYSIECLD